MANEERLRRYTNVQIYLVEKQVVNTQDEYTEIYK